MTDVKLYQCKKCKTITSEERVLCKECHSLEPFDIITPFDLVNSNQLKILMDMFTNYTKSNFELQQDIDVVALFILLQKAKFNKKNKEEQDNVQ